MLKTTPTGGIYVHPWDINEEGLDLCFDYLEDVCGFNEIFIASSYHASTFILPHNPKRMVRWDDGALYFTPQHPRWRETRIKPPVAPFVDTPGFMHNVVDNARMRDWSVVFFTMYHFMHSTAQQYPDACQVDVFGETHRACLCPGNPDVRAHDLAMTEDLMSIYGADGIRFESLGFSRWNYGVMVSKVDVPPPARDQFLLSLCFCGSCLKRAMDDGFDPNPLRRELRQYLSTSLGLHPDEQDLGEVTEEWARNLFNGRLWQYLEVRCKTVTSLYEEVRDITDRYHGGFMPVGVQRTGDILRGVDYSRFYSRAQRTNVGPRGTTLDERRQSLIDSVCQVPDNAAPLVEHYQLRFRSEQDLVEDVLMHREVGVKHHTFYYYGQTPRYQLEWIGKARAAWAE